MVILQFNKLIRNKWVWGVFAIAISAFFAFDFLLDDVRRGDDGRVLSEVGVLAGEPVDAKLFGTLAHEIRTQAGRSNIEITDAQVNRDAIATYAALQVAAANGIETSDAEVQQIIRGDRNFQVNGAFNFDHYVALLRQNGMTPEAYEANLKHQLALWRLQVQLLGSSVWIQQSTVDRLVADRTDEFTVKVANFKMDPKEAEAVKVDDAGLRKWYDDHVKAFEVPECAKVRTVRFDATDKDVLAKMNVTTQDVQATYNATIDQYMVPGTNGEAATYREFAEVYDQVERETRRLAAVMYFETNLNNMVQMLTNTATCLQFDAISAQMGNRVVTTSDWFCVDGGYVEGFTQRSTSVCPGADKFEEVVGQLAEGTDVSCGVVLSDTSVWLIERLATRAPYTASFEESKEILRPQALEEARQEAFKDKVNAIAKQGAEAVSALKDVSTNYVFSVRNLEPGQFPDEMAVAQAAMKLYKGEVSEFVRTGRDMGVLVVCVERTAGDPAQGLMMRDSVVQGMTMAQLRPQADAWRKWNVDRMGFEPGPDLRLDEDEASK